MELLRVGLTFFNAYGKLGVERNKMKKNKKDNGNMKFMVAAGAAVVLFIATIILGAACADIGRHYAAVYEGRTYTSEQQEAYADAVAHLAEKIVSDHYFVEIPMALSDEDEAGYFECLKELDMKPYEIIERGVTEDNNFYIKYQNYVPTEYSSRPTDKVTTMYFWKDEERGTYSYAYGYGEN